ncbi:MAG: DUF421 domain-containing protein [Lachnospiraceae bacterium]|nr:DUF421 domain-containing protein [Lachnospiraceae bacterium]
MGILIKKHFVRYSMETEIGSVIVTSLLSAAALFVIAKLMGHKQVAQLDFFDYISGITIGSMAAEFATELEEPWKPFTAMVVYGSISFGLSILTSRIPRIRKYVNGSPTVILNNGKLYRSNMKKAKLDLSEFMVMCREAGYFNLSDIQTALFEYNGKITILPVSNKRPVNPADMKLAPPPEYISTEVIMDGRIFEENLRQRGLDTKWLQEQLEAQGYHSVTDIFLGVCDGNNRLQLFTGE